MSGVTDNRSDPRLPKSSGPDESPVPQQDVYLVLSVEERARGFVRPVRGTYRHVGCTVEPGATTTMGSALAETYARNPFFYSATYCCACRMHRPVGVNGEFEWLDGSKVGS